MPKCADGYCYVHCTNKKLAVKTKGAIDIINKQIGLTFIYTDSPHIADIIIQRWSDKKLNDSIWLRDDEIDQIRNNGDFWAGVAFSIEGLHYLICINWDYVYNNDIYCKSVIIHELGHCIGIGHSDDVTSIMYPSCMGIIKMTPSDIINFKKQREKLRSL